MDYVLIVYCTYAQGIFIYMVSYDHMLRMYGKSCPKEEMIRLLSFFNLSYQTPTTQHKTGVIF